MSRRRDFLQTLGLMGLGLPAVSKIVESNAHNNFTAGEPMLMCSRGEDWGRKILEPAWNKLQESKSILDALETGTNVCELDPSDMSVGYGGLPNERGVVQLDACIMYGPTHKCGSVASLEKIKTPCSIARLVMERTDHIMLVGPGALEFAKAHGFKEEELLTEDARIAWLEWKENLSKDDDWLPPADGKYDHKERKRGTVNVIGMGFKNEVAGITSTSGLFGKIPGRIGDSPIIGAGLYVDNEVGAAGATGRGEEVIRICGSYLLIEKMRSGMSPQAACEAVLEKIVSINGGLSKVDFDVKMIAMNIKGESGVAAIAAHGPGIPQASVYTSKGLQVIDGSFMKRTRKD